MQFMLPASPTATATQLSTVQQLQHKTAWTPLQQMMPPQHQAPASAARPLGAVAASLVLLQRLQQQLQQKRTAAQRLHQRWPTGCMLMMP